MPSHITSPPNSTSPFRRRSLLLHPSKSHGEAGHRHYHSFPRLAKRFRVQGESLVRCSRKFRMEQDNIASKSIGFRPRWAAVKALQIQNR